MAAEIVPEPRAESAPAISVLLVDDSPLARRLARNALATLPGCTVVAEGTSGREAVELTLRLRPDVVLLDLNLPHLPGLAAIGQIMAARPTPIVVLSGDVADDPTGTAGAEALAAGAVSLLPKPRLSDGQDAEAHAEALRRAVHLASRARVITHPRPRAAARPAPRPGRGSARPLTSAIERRAAAPAVEVVVIGASTGGPAALAAVLSALPADFPVPVLVVQHMGESFVEGLARWLDGQCALSVAVGVEGQRLAVGTVTLAPGGSNTELTDGLALRLLPAGAQQWHVPSVDLAFASAASMVGPAAVGILLTGMGRDGATGLVALRAAGGCTIAQDEATSAVWGMPGAAVDLDAAELVLPLDQVAAAIRLVTAR